MSLSIAGLTLAATWSEMSLGGPAGGMAVVDSAAVVVFESGGAVHLQRSTDSGATWGTQQEVSPSASQPAIAGLGSDVDVVWIDGNEVMYAHSTDSGMSFGSPVGLRAPSDDTAELPLVARGPDGLVAVVWSERPPGDDEHQVRLSAAVSADGGSSFTGSTELADAENEPGWGEPTRALAVGSGVVYVAYHNSGRLLVHRSLDAGQRWEESAVLAISDGKRLNSVMWIYPSIAAWGDEAYVAYTSADDNWDNSWVRYRRTTDKGQTWSRAVDLSSPRRWADRPIVSLHDGVARVAFERCEFWERYCDLGTEWASAVVYRQHLSGNTWSSEERLSSDTSSRAYPVSMGFTGQVIVLYQSEEFGELGNAYVVFGTPVILPPTDTSPPAGSTEVPSNAWIVPASLGALWFAAACLLIRRQAGHTAS